MNEDNGKILIVDDDIDVLQSTTDYLQGEGFQVDSYETIDDAQRALSTNQYFAAIIDMDFPLEYEGGIKIVEYIKEKQIPTLPIIFTGKGTYDNLKKIFKDIYDYVEKDESAIERLCLCLRNAMAFNQSKNEVRDLSGKINIMNKELGNLRIEKENILDDVNYLGHTKIELENKIKLLETEKEEYKKKYFNELERSNENKSPIYQSTHTFEKCYNIPTRNFCYRIRKKVPLRFKEAHDLTNMIDDSIDLWANQFSMELCDPGTKNSENSQSIKWIDSFSWNPFQKDLEHFIEQYFIMNINDLLDHYSNQFFEKENKLISLSNIYDKKCSWSDFISFNFEKNNINIMGVRPFFRAILINMISNAVEAMNFYNFTQSKVDKSSIIIKCNQNAENTIIEIQSLGKPMDQDRVDYYNGVIFELAKRGELKLSETSLENDIHDKKFTTKPGIGSGYALIHAAHYFSRIEREPERGQMTVKTNGNQTTFTITLPFGKTTTELFEKDKNAYYSNNNTRFRWHKSSISENFYEKIKNKKLINRHFELPEVPIIKKNLNQLPEKNDKEILIIEDSRPDRFRMRMLIEHLFIRYKRFAWDAKKKSVLSVKSILDLMEKTQPNILVLDLAWTTYDEKNLNGMLFQTEDQIALNFKQNKFIRKPHSFELLEKIKNNNSSSFSSLDQIIIMSQFFPPVADGLKFYIEKNYIDHIKKKINVDILHKWRHEEKFREILINNQRRK